MLWNIIVTDWHCIILGTGDLRDIGAGKGKYYAVNIPLRDGMDDEAYESIFVPIISKVMETFQPSAVVSDFFCIYSKFIFI